MQIKLKQIVLYCLLAICVVATTAYLSFPWWAALAVRGYLPQGWQVQQIEIAYPSPDGVRVNSALLQTKTFKFEIHGLLLDFDLQHLQLEHVWLRVKTIPENSNQQPFDQWQLPVLELSRYLENYAPFEVLIKQVKLEQTDKSKQTVQYLQLNNLSLKLLDQQKSKLGFKLADSSFFAANKTSPLEPQLKGASVDLLLWAEKQKAHAKVNINNKNILAITYQSAAKISKAALSLKLDKLQPLLMPLLAPTLNEIFPSLTPETIAALRLSKPLQLSVEQDNKTRRIHSQLRYQGELSVPQLSAEPLNLSLAASSDSQSFPLMIETSLQIETQARLELKQALMLDKPRLAFSGQLEFKRNDLLLNKPKINVNWSEMDFSKHDLSSGKADIEINLNNFSIKHFPANNLTANVKVNPTQVAFKKDEIQQITSSKSFSGLLSAQFQVNNPDSPLLSGKLMLSQIQNSRWQASPEAYINVSFDQLDSRRLQGKLAFELQDSGGEIGALSYEDLQTHLNLNAKADTINGHGNLRLNHTKKLPFTISFDKSSSALNLKLPEHSTEPTLVNQLLAQILPQDQPQIKLDSGKLVYSASLQHNQSLKILGDIRLSEGDIIFDQNRANKVSLKSQIDYSDDKKAQKSAQRKPIIKNQLKVKSIDFSSGLKLDSLSAEINFINTKELQLDKLKFTLFEGEISAHKLNLLNARLSPATVNAKNLSLTELMFFIGMDSLYADGKINLALPVRSENNELILEAGTFHNTTPGVIKYDSGVDAQSSGNIALQALENFHYKQLDGRLDYDAQGRYKIRIHLLGFNPALYDGYPVDFVMNISGQLPGLFNSLFLSGSFEQSILESVNMQNQQ